MKKLLYILLFVPFVLFGQNFSGLHFKGTVTDENGWLVRMTDVAIKISILNNSSDKIYNTVQFSKRPLFRPLFVFETKESYDHVLKAEDDKTNIETISIIVGFYYNKYNAEQDLPSILLSDSSLSDKVNAEVIKDVYMKKQGFRINIYPLSKKSALRACEKIKASGELCEISDK